MPDKKILLASALLLVSAAATGQQMPARVVQISMVSEAEIAPTVAVPGTIYSRNDVQITAGVAGQLWMVSTYSGVQMAVPEEMRGRVMGLVFMLVTLAQLGALLVGMLADGIGDQLAMGIFGLIPSVALALLLVRGRRDLWTL